MSSAERVLAQLDDLSRYSWPIRRGITAEHIPAILRAAWKSVFTVAPVGDNRSSYYDAMLRSILQLLTERRLSLPNEQLRGEVMVQFEGSNYLLNPQALFGYYLLPGEPITRRFMNSLSGEIFVDIGANVGQYTIPLAKRFRRVVSVEPNPTAVRLLWKNIAANALRNVTVVEGAIAPEGGLVRLYEGDFLGTWSTIPRRAASILVPSLTLTELLHPFESVDLLKVDVEGAESSVLDVDSLTLRKVRTIVVETHSKPLIRSLANHGFTLQVLGGWIHRWENLCATQAVG